MELKNNEGTTNTQTQDNIEISTLTTPGIEPYEMATS